MINHAASTISAHTNTSSLHTSIEATSLEDVNKNGVSSISTPAIQLPLCDKRHHKILHEDDNSVNAEDGGHDSETMEDDKSQSQIEFTSTPIIRRKKQGSVAPSLPTIHSSSKMTERERSESLCSREVKISRRKKTKRKRRRMMQSPQILRKKVSIAPSIDVDRDVKGNICDHEYSQSQSSVEPQTTLHLSVDQYECVLRRRAIRKKQISPHNFMAIPQPKSRSKLSLIPDDDNDEANDLRKHGIKVPFPDEDEIEIEGDISLGMKLTILSGKVIVQNLVSLQDGRASPAQLTGMISRGDILLSIDDQSLLGLGNLELLLKRLAPLSTPRESGLYKRCVRVRFALGEGLQLLAKDDGQQKKTQQKQQQKKVGNKFNLENYTIVDQLSGTPLFNNLDSDNAVEVKEGGSQLNTGDRENNDVPPPLSPKKAKIIPLNRSISYHVAMEQQRDKSNFTSRYFSMNEKASSLLRPMEDEIIPESFEDATKKKEELLFMGRRALTRARYLFNQVELGPLKRKMDPLQIVRSECRSFSSRSRFSQKYIHQSDSDDDLSDDESSDNDSMIPGENGEEEIGDEMLLRLAVWNRSWKKRMVETLEAASIRTREKMNKEADEKKENAKQRKKNDNLESQLQNLFFGSEVTEMMNKKKPTVALPPDEITEVLFDLATRVTATIPTNVNIINGFDSSIHELDRDEVISSQIPNSNVDMEVFEATRFLLDDILPAWMDTFKPIPNHQRRVLWPLVKDGSSVATPDDLSMESAATGWSTGSPERRAKLEDKIAHLELDADTKIETCELVTFYFTRKMIPAISTAKEEQVREGGDSVQFKTDAEEAVVIFIKAYGSYLKLFESFVAVSESKSERVMQSLSGLAKNDPCHNDCMKQLVRNVSTVLYESKYLSCLLVWLEIVLNDSKSPMPERLLPLIVAAYPDIKPWQVRSHIPSFTGNPGEIIEGRILEAMETKDSVLYYIYLSLLMDSNHMARMDGELVREWCVMSTSTDLKSENESRLENFMQVASRNQSSYNRDLSFLVDTSVLIQNTSLTLELVDEIITESERSISSGDALKKALKHLMAIAVQCIQSTSKEGIETLDLTLMCQVLVLLNKMDISTNKEGNNSISLSDELLKLLTLCTTASNSEEEIVRVMTDTISPCELLRALSLWQPSPSVSISSIVCALRKSLCRGVECSTLIEGNGEISVALLRVRKIRQKDKGPAEEDINYIGRGMTIWETMERGMAAAINK
jgi:hypothetical protein